MRKAWCIAKKLKTANALQTRSGMEMSASHAICQNISTWIQWVAKNARRDSTSIGWNVTVCRKNDYESVIFNIKSYQKNEDSGLTWSIMIINLPRSNRFKPKKRQQKSLKSSNFAADSLPTGNKISNALPKWVPTRPLNPSNTLRPSAKNQHPFS